MTNLDLTWRGWVMGVMVLAISALIGLGLDATRRDIEDLRETTRRLEDIIDRNSNRLTRLEQVDTAHQDQLHRIEAGVERLIQQHVK